MRIIEKIKKKQADMFNERQPVIAFLGDSVTHGCFDIYIKNDNLETSVYFDKVYHAKVKKILATIYPTVPINFINAGISGDSAEGGCKRLERDVLSYKPDLVTVCYGLNDSMGAEEGTDKYIGNLKEIFDRIKENGAEVIFITPNLMSDKFDMTLGDKRLDDCVKGIIEAQKGGWLAKYLDKARELCKNENIPVCDCNALWNVLKDNDVDINNLLSNRINHPVAEMHYMFAYELVKTMFER